MLGGQTPTLACEIERVAPADTDIPTADTRGIPDDTADGTWLVCMSCGRVLRSDTGEVIARVSGCAHCADLVAPFPRDTYLGSGYPFIDGDQMWRHLDSHDRTRTSPPGQHRHRHHQKHCRR